MSRKENRKENKPSPAVTHSRWREIFGVAIVALGLFMILALVSYSPLDVSLNSTGIGTSPVRNMGGVVGAYLADLSIQSLGWAAFVIPLFFLALGVNRFFTRNWGGWALRAAGAVLFVLTLCVLAQLRLGPLSFTGVGMPAGGIAGKLAAEGLVSLLNVAGAHVFVLAMFTVSIIVMTNVSLRTVGAGVAKGGGYVVTTVTKRLERTRRQKVVSRAREKEMKVTPPTITSKPEVTTTRPPVLPRQEEFDTLPRPRGKFSLPPLHLLDPPDPRQRGISEEEHLLRSRMLVKKLQDYGIHGQVTAVNPGPVITVFEYEPGPGVKVNQIVSRAGDLSLAMGGVEIRIVERIPGKSAIGIEVPNAEPEMVGLREILSSAEFESAKGLLRLAIGKDTSGVPFVTELDNMPHMLVAGATGTGKSVAINSMILSMLFNLTPDEVRFLMVDPKMLELSPYEGIPHLLSPVVMEPKKAASALRWLVAEMERRYQLLASRKARDVDSYNRKTAKITEPLPEGEDSRLPHIVVIIDELADLMMTASRDVEECIARLGQMARAAGIHLILATQRPSVDIISGSIKTNITGRIAFKVTDKANSRVILDHNGAEQLLGRGDMLFIKTGMSGLVRLHGCFVAEDEVSRVVKFLKDQAKPEYRDDLFDYEPPAQGSDLDDGAEDEKYHEVLDFVRSKGYVSASMIQRNFKVGYNRAARMVERMEAENIIGPPDGARPRPVLRRYDFE
ncbi:MAG: DNA translocase FtsK 4TM domain-containing protein [bacterium]|nr:MAG: DNA translocase FtsK 4TM domain-containing protein [bacterium]